LPVAYVIPEIQISFSIQSPRLLPGYHPTRRPSIPFHRLPVLRRSGGEEAYAHAGRSPCSCSITGHGKGRRNSPRRRNCGGEVQRRSWWSSPSPTTLELASSPLELLHHYQPPMHPENPYQSLAYAAPLAVESCSEPVPGHRSYSATLPPEGAHDGSLVPLSAAASLGDGALAGVAECQRATSATPSATPPYWP
jgi:hypothetical protein